jgi:hypothetical protein
MAARAKGLDDGMFSAAVNWSGLPALHDFDESRRWLRRELKSFVLDTLDSQNVREAAIFDRTVLKTVLVEHFARSRDHYDTVLFALDLALAQQIFCCASHQSSDA